KIQELRCSAGHRPGCPAFRLASDSQDAVLPPRSQKIPLRPDESPWRTSCMEMMLAAPGRKFNMGKKGIKIDVRKPLQNGDFLLHVLTRINRTFYLTDFGGITMRVAIYARVSTDDKGQNPENQLISLREWCARSGHEIVAEYVEHESGRKGAEGRRQFARLFEDAHRRQFDMVLFWALDRFS